MADEWACETCGHTTPIDPGEEGCPECGKKMKRIVDFDKDTEDSGKYDEEDLDTPMEEDFDEEDFDKAA